jgi:hypothetical protein
MKVQTSKEKFDNMRLIENKIRYLLGAKLRNKTRMQKAVEIQNNIRNHHSHNSSWDGVLEIRKWREIR